MLGSFLQHGKTRKADEAAKPQGQLTVEVDEVPLIIRFHQVTQYAHQYAKFSTSIGNPLAGWHYPGGAVRHVGLTQTSTALEEPPGRALALRYAPIGAIYFEIRRAGTRPRYTLILPEVSNLESYTQARFCFLRYMERQRIIEERMKGILLPCKSFSGTAKCTPPSLLKPYAGHSAITGKRR